MECLQVLPKRTQAGEVVPCIMHTELRRDCARKCVSSIRPNTSCCGLRRQAGDGATRHVRVPLERARPPSRL